MPTSRSVLAATFVTAWAVVAAQVTVAGTPQNPPADQAGPAGRGRGAGGPAAGQGQGRGRVGGGGGGATFPAQQRPPGDPAEIALGKSLYEVNCRACHGADLRGGDMGGPNLLRSQIVLRDDEGELILPIVQNGRQTAGMPPMPALGLPAANVKAIAAYIHSVAATMGRQGRPPEGPPVELDILVGDAAAGQRYFASKCAACHSPTGDLRGIASRVADPKDLQNLWVSGSGGGGGPDQPTTVRVTMPSGEVVEGPLVRWDDFSVVVRNADGTTRTIPRNGKVPTVEIRHPLQPHLDLLPVYTDKDIHDVTAYLVTLK